jgi:hypothetical protein
VCGLGVQCAVLHTPCVTQAVAAATAAAAFSPSPLIPGRLSLWLTGKGVAPGQDLPCREWKAAGAYAACVAVSEWSGCVLLLLLLHAAEKGTACSAGYLLGSHLCTGLLPAVGMPRGQPSCAAAVAWLAGTASVPSTGAAAGIWIVYSSRQQDNGRRACSETACLGQF